MEERKAIPGTFHEQTAYQFPNSTKIVGISNQKLVDLRGWKSPGLIDMATVQNIVVNWNGKGLPIPARRQLQSEMQRSVVLMLKKGLSLSLNDSGGRFCLLVPELDKPSYVRLWLAPELFEEGWS